MIKHKRNSLIVLFAIVALDSCSGTPSSSAQESQSGNLSETERLSQFISKARIGFKFMGKKNQNCKDLSGNDLFTNTYSYNYSFENGESGVRTKQRLVYKYNGENQSASIQVSRSPDGYVAQEYVNYKNEIAYYKISDDDGYYSFYDEYFTNPFLVVDSEDFTFLAQEEDTYSYSLANDKLDTFDYFLTGNNEPLSELVITVKEDGTGSIRSKSVSFTGRTKDEEGNYIRCSWTFESNFTLSNLGAVTIEGATTSEAKENSELFAILNSVDDNFTLTCSLVSPETGEEVGTKKISYFDGESYYIKSSSDDNTMVNDYLYHKDPFNGEDDSLYEYRYDEASKLWHKSDTSESTNYNVTPQKKDVFVPHLKEMSKDIFNETANQEGYYAVDNEDAKAFAGEGFFSDAEVLPYFSLGYGSKAKIKKEGNDVVALVDFYYPYDSSTLLSVQYKAVYSSIGTTSIPEVDL